MVRVPSDDVLTMLLIEVADADRLALDRSTPLVSGVLDHGAKA